MALVNGYIRISKDDEENPSLSPDVQRQTILAYCKMKQLTSVEFFEDRGVSGGIPFAHRSGGGALNFILCEPGSMIVAVRQDRLFRDSVDALTTMKDWLAKGYVPVCIAEGLDLSTPAGRLMFSFMASMAQYEREIIGERTRVVLQAKKEAGKQYSGSTPYGWEATEAGELVEVREEIVILQWMRNLRSRGWSDRKIAHEANERGIPAKQGGPWGHSSVKSVLDVARPPRAARKETPEVYESSEEAGGDLVPSPEVQKYLDIAEQAEQL